MNDSSGAILVVDDFWFEAPLGEEWNVAYRILGRPEGLVVGEIRIFPKEDPARHPRARLGEWSGDLQGTHAAVPEGASAGVTSRLLRRVRVDRNVWFGKEALEDLTRRYGLITDTRHPAQGHAFLAHALTRVGIKPQRLGPPERRHRLGRKRLPDRDYQRIAEVYTGLWVKGVRGNRLYTQLATRFKLTESQARNRVARAKKYGFLSQAPARRRKGR